MERKKERDRAIKRKRDRDTDVKCKKMVESLRKRNIEIWRKRER